MFGFCITHILNTECAKIWKKKKIRHQKVNVAAPKGILSPFLMTYELQTTDFPSDLKVKEVKFAL